MAVAADTPLNFLGVLIQNPGKYLLIPLPISDYTESSMVFGHTDLHSDYVSNKSCKRFHVLFNHIEYCKGAYFIMCLLQLFRILILLQNTCKFKCFL